MAITLLPISALAAEAITISGNIVCANGIPIVIKENGSITSVYDESGALLSGDTDVKDKWIAGGWQSGEHEGDTSVTVESGTLNKRIYGGNFEGTIIGNTNIAINGGTVGSIFGGNEKSGTVTDTHIEVNGGTVTGWVYGGGAGASGVTEVTGSTNIAINGGILLHNIYGGGGWRGAKVGAANITINGGTLQGSIYGGSEEAGTTGDVTIIAASSGNIANIYAGGAGFGSTNSTVDGDVSIEVKSGTVEYIYGSGDGYVDTETPDNSQTSTVTGAVDVTLSGGSVQYVYAIFFINNDSGAQVGGDFSVAAEGGQILNGCYLGEALLNPQTMGNVSLKLKGQTAQACSIQFPAPITGSLDVIIEDHFQELMMAAGVLTDAASAALIYKNCGTENGTWAAYSGNSHSAGTNPYTAFASINGNQFDSVTLKNCYLDYDNYVANSGSLKAIAKGLVLDGGALRTYSGENALFPATEFLNNPLLLYGREFKSGYGNSPIIFDSVTGNARLATIAVNGNPNTAAFSTLPTGGLVVAPDTAPKDTFSYINLRDSEAYLLGTDTYGSPATQTTWELFSADNCKCNIHDLQLETQYFHLDSVGISKTVAIKELQDGKTDQAADCHIVGHAGKPVMVDYAVESGSDAPGAAIANGNKLTVTGPGIVDVRVTETLNIQEKSGTIRTAFVGIPEQLSFTDKTGDDDTISITLLGSGLSSKQIRNCTTTNYLYATQYNSTFSDGALTVTLNSDYLNSLAAGSYEMQLTYNCNGITTDDTIPFTVTITDKDIPIIAADDIAVTYSGAALASSVITGTATYNGQAVSGTWSWKNTAPTNVTDSGKHTVVFTPTDESAYAIVETNVNITIEKSAPTGSPKYIAISASGKTLADAALTVEGGTISTTGSVKWVDASDNNLANTTTVAANTSYRWLFTPTDTANYDTLSGSITLYSVSSGGDGGSSSTTVTVPVTGGSRTVSFSASVSGSTATVSATDTQLQFIASGTKSDTIKIDVSGLKVDAAVIPTAVVSAVGAASGSTDLAVALPAGTVTLDKAALASISGKGDVKIFVETVNNSALTDAQNAVLGSQASTAFVVDVNVFVNGIQTGTFGDGRITVSVPYTPKSGENTNSITVWFIKDDGTIEPKNGAYNAATGCVEFTTEHLSQYLIVSFPYTDVAKNAWYYNSVAYAYNNGLFAGTSAMTFSPDTVMTRQMIWMVLSRMDGKAPADMDAARAWAMETGISDGSNPTSSITREQMAAILYRYAQYKAYDTTQGGMSIREFADYDSISEYALAALGWSVNAGLMQGSDNNLEPSGIASRAQVVTILQRFCQNVAK